MNIALDIGHANNTGSRGNGLEEHATAMTIADHLAPMLRAQGHNVEIIDFHAWTTMTTLPLPSGPLTPEGSTFPFLSTAIPPILPQPAEPVSATTAITATTVLIRIPHVGE